jgi:hypothetical protein
MHYFFQKLPHPNSMMRFDLTTHNSIGGDDTTRPRRQGVFLHTFIPNIIRQCKLSYKLQHYHAHLCEPPKSLHPGGNRTVDLLFLRGLRRHWATPPGQVCTTLISASCTECAYYCSHRVSVFSKFFLNPYSLSHYFLILCVPFSSSPTSFSVATIWCRSPKCRKIKCRMNLTPPDNPPQGWYPPPRHVLGDSKVGHVGLRIILAAWSSGIVSACHRGGWSYGSW